MKHTEGQWYMDWNSGQIEVCVQDKAVPSHEVTIARVEHNIGGGEKQAEANANLIAAAPDGFEAAKQAVNVLRRLPMIENDALSMAVELTCDKLQDFIAKAQGE